jgi:hypothetical protein
MSSLTLFASTNSTAESRDTKRYAWNKGLKGMSLPRRFNR